MNILAGILLAVGILVLLSLAYLLVIAVVPGFTVPRQPLSRVADATPPTGEKGPAAREDVSFSVQGVDVRAWLYLPAAGTEGFPCIVMASGLGGTRDMGEPYALRFREAGFAVLSFDYRYFGQSGGTPRQLIWIPDQLEDWAAAIDYARRIPRVDPGRIALWGTSLSGGHVIVAASRDHGISCVVAQCPGVDGRESAKMTFQALPVRHTMRMVMHGQRDLVRSWLRLSPHTVPIVGRPGSLALMTAPGAFESFSHLARDGFINEACARIIIRGDKYRPISYAPGVRCPVLLQMCEQDRLVPMHSIEETARILGGKAHVARYPIGHFDIYFGENLEASLRDQVGFFKKHLT